MQVDVIKSGVESAYAFNAINYDIINCFQRMLSVSTCAATPRGAPCSTHRCDRSGQPRTTPPPFPHAPCRCAGATAAGTFRRLPGTAATRRGCARQGLTLVDFSAQPDTFFVTETLKAPGVSHKRCLRRAEKWTSVVSPWCQQMFVCADLAPGVTQAGPGRCCPPRRPHVLQPSFIGLHSVSPLVPR